MGSAQNNNNRIISARKYTIEHTQVFNSLLEHDNLQNPPILSKISLIMEEIICFARGHETKIITKGLLLLMWHNTST